MQHIQPALSVIFTNLHVALWLLASIRQNVSDVQPSLRRSSTATAPRLTEVAMEYHGHMRVRRPCMRLDMLSRVKIEALLSDQDATQSGAISCASTPIAFSQLIATKFEVSNKLAGSPDFGSSLQ